jgi:tetratricopeptide (TPR) repeat protein
MLIYDNNKQHPDVASALFNVANSYYQLNQYADALNYYLKSLEIRKTKTTSLNRINNQHRQDLADTLFNVAVLYFRNQNIENALINGLEALEIMRNTEDELNCLVLISQCYFMQNDFVNGLEFCLRTLERTIMVENNRINDEQKQRHKITLLYMLTKLYRRLNDKENCIKYGRMALETTISNEIRLIILDELKLILGDCYSELNNHANDGHSQQHITAIELMSSKRIEMCTINQINN